MAKFNMKDYEDFMKEEERQDRLQEDLEDKNTAEYWDTYENWQEWQEWQREEEYRQKQEDHDFYYDWDYDWDYDPLSDYYWYAKYWDDILDDDDCDDDECDDDGFREFCSSAPEMEDHDLYPLIDELSKSIFLEGYDGAYATRERLAKKSVARNRHLSKVKAKKSKAQKANYVAKREMRKCCKLYRNLDKAYWQLANKAYSDGYLPYSMCQNMERRVNANLDQMSDIVLKAHYFECILGAPMYKQALSAPKAM